MFVSCGLSSQELGMYAFKKLMTFCSFARCEDVHGT